MNFDIRAYKELGYIYTLIKLNDKSLRVNRGTKVIYKTMLRDLPEDNTTFFKLSVGFVHFIDKYDKYDYYRQMFFETFKKSRIFVEEVNKDKFLFAPIDHNGDFILKL